MFTVRRLGFTVRVHLRRSSGCTRIIAALKEAIATRDLDKGKLAHSLARHNGDDSNVYVANTLLDMYCKCGSVDLAEQVFEKMDYRTEVSWSVLISGYAHNGDGASALEAFESMKREGVRPHRAAYLAALKACSSLAADVHRVSKEQLLARVKCIHSEASDHGFESDIILANSLVDVYGKCGGMVDARGVFDRISVRDSVSWTSIIWGYAENGEGETALKMFSCMLREGCEVDRAVFLSVIKALGNLAGGDPGKRMNVLEKGREIRCQAATRGYGRDIYVAKSLIDMYSKCGSVHEARRVFESVQGVAGCSWSSMMSGYVHNGDGVTALELFEEMRAKNCVLDSSSFVAAVQACSCLAETERACLVDGKRLKVKSLEQGRCIHTQAAIAGCDSDSFLVSTLVAMYAKCGSMVHAQEVFENAVHRTVVSWTALILGFAQNSQGLQ